MNDAPAYIKTDQDAHQMSCKRCRHVIGVDYGRRLEVIDERGKIVHIITSSYSGRCPECFEFYKWHAQRRSA